MKHITTHPLIATFFAIAVLFSMASLVPTIASADTLPPGVSQAQMDAAMAELSELYGSPVVRQDQARAICNQEQYVVECAEIGQRNGLFPEERAEQVDELLEVLKGEVVEKMKQCSSVDCLVDVARTVSENLSTSNPGLASTVDLTVDKVEEKKIIADAANSVGVDIRECQTMDPDTASVDLLRSCAKLAQLESVQQFIPDDRREHIDKTENTIALKEALSKGELSCGDGTIEGCGSFCLVQSVDSGDDVAIPQVCRDIAERFFGEEGVTDLERAHENVHQRFVEAKEIYDFPPKDNFDYLDFSGTTSDRFFCPIVDYQPCPGGEYRQESVNEFGCSVFSACIPFNTQTQPDLDDDRRITCPAIPTVEACGAGEERVVSFLSPECGTYYSCVPSANQTVDFPFIFPSGKVSVSFDEARNYCYDISDSGASRRGDMSGCDFLKILVPTTPVEPTAQCSTFGPSWHSMDDSGNCFNGEMTEYVTPNGVRNLCSDNPVYGCSDKPLFEAPSGQREHQWNTFGLRSWIRDDADSERITSLEQACSNVSAQSYIWMPNAGDPSSSDFGMPDPDKCSQASACEIGKEIFDGTTCLVDPLYDPVWPENPTDPNPISVSGSCSSDLIALLGTGCHSMGNAWFNGEMTSYVMPGGSAVRSCTAEYLDGCTVWSNDQTCPSGEYWNSDGRRCESSSTGSMARCFYPNATIDNEPAGFTVWCEADYYNCREGSESGPAISLSNLSLGAPSSCEAGYPTSGQECPSDQYWFTPSGGGSGYCTPYDNTPSDGCPSGFHYHSENGGFCINDQENYSGTCYNASGTEVISCPAVGSNTSSCDSYTSQSTCTSYSNCHWDSGNNYCYYDSSGGVSSSCSSDQYWDSRTNSCESMEAACAEAGGTWDGASNFCNMPNDQSTSCGSDQYWDGSTCVNNPTPDPSTSCGSDQYWDGSSCITSTQSCSSDQYWDSRTNSCESMEAACAEAGGTWDGASNFCDMPSSSAPEPTPEPTPEPEPATTTDPAQACSEAGGTWNSDSGSCDMTSASLGTTPLAFACPNNHSWNGTHCVFQLSSEPQNYIANIFSVFKRLLAK